MRKLKELRPAPRPVFSFQKEIKMGDTSWRPSSFEEFVGQKELIELLRDETDASKAEMRPIANVLLYGPPGLGKTAIADLLAEVRGVPCHSLVGPAVTIESISRLLGNISGEGYDDKGNLVNPESATFPIIVLDECEEMPRKVWESLHYCLEPVRGISTITAKVEGNSKLFQAWVPQITWIAITNYYGKLKKNASAAVSRFPIKWNFQPYELDEVEQLLTQYAERVEIPVTADAITAMAERSLGIPRNAIALIRQARTRVVAMAERDELDDLTITVDIAAGSAKLLRVDDHGLPPQHRRYLDILAKSCGKIGLPTLAAGLSMDEETIRTDIEPDLIRKDFVNVVSGGRQLTPTGLKYVGIDNASPLLARRL